MERESGERESVGAGAGAGRGRLREPVTRAGYASRLRECGQSPRRWTTFMFTVIVKDDHTREQRRRGGWQP